MFSHFVLFVFCVVGCGRQSPVLSRMYLIGHVFFAIHHKDSLQDYSVQQQSIDTNDRDKNRARNKRVKKVSQLMSMNDQTGKTLFDRLLQPYIDLYQGFSWDCIVPDDAQDGYKHHEVDFNEWDWGNHMAHN